MKTMKIFEPAMCCPTGLCGVSVDPELLRISTVLNTLKENGATVQRYNLTSAPMEFVNHTAVAEFLKKFGPEKLPVVIDTASTGHTLLLLESTESYDKEIQRTKGETSESVKRLLPRLKSAETEVIIVTLPEATPVYEAMRLEDDLSRAQIAVNWWVINQSFYHANTTNSLLKAKASNEVEWINRIDRHNDGKFAVLLWQ